MKYVKVKDNENLIRDLSSNAVINTDISEYNKYIQERENRKTNLNRISNLENELCELKNSIDEIKNLLKNLANGS